METNPYSAVSWLHCGSKPGNLTQHVLAKLHYRGPNAYQAWRPFKSIPTCMIPVVSLKSRRTILGGSVKSSNPKYPHVELPKVAIEGWLIYK